MLDFLPTICFVLCLQYLPVVIGQGVPRYYGTYYITPTGESRVRLTFNYGGPATPRTKWMAECRDGEGMVGFRDTADDFEDLQEAKCRFLFPYKPPTRGLYPFFENCNVRNLTDGQYHCFDPALGNNTVNSFVVGLWDEDPIFRPSLILRFRPDFGTKIKCCSMPPGYFVDYSGCHFRYSHDQFYNYYDSFFYTLQCPDRYAMVSVGLLDPPQDENLHVDWIMCCPYAFTPIAGATDFAAYNFDYTQEYMDSQYNTRKMAARAGNKRYNKEMVPRSEAHQLEQGKRLLLNSYQF